jgi:hypothetical protein
VDLSWQACHTYIVEGELVRRHVRDNCGLIHPAGNGLFHIGH